MKFRKDEETRYFVRMVMSLALLPPEGIPLGFSWLSRMAETAEAKSLLEYYSKTWLMVWQPEEYSVFGKKIRTNNDLEGW